MVYDLSSFGSPTAFCMDNEMAFLMCKKNPQKTKKRKCLPDYVLSQALENCLDSGEMKMRKIQSLLYLYTQPQIYL